MDSGTAILHSFYLHTVSFKYCYLMVTIQFNIGIFCTHLNDQNNHLVAHNEVVFK